MATTSSAPLRVIEPPKGFSLPSLRELWDQRELIYFLGRREVSARYKQTVIGVFWVVLQPLLLALVFTVFFGKLARVPSEAGVPYPPFALSGMVLWLFFASAVSRAAESTVANETLISKVYFPRIIIPLAAVCPPLVDFCIAFVIVVLAVLVYGIVPPIQIFLMPVVVVMTLALAVGVGLWLSALNVRYRDISAAIPFLILLGLFVSPITYPFHLVPHDLRTIYAINPLVGILETYRWMLFPSADWPGWIAFIPIVESGLLLVTGAAFFQRSESAFADVI
jgi:lipopolysaccharide transport system permease protein